MYIKDLEIEKKRTASAFVYLVNVGFIILMIGVFLLLAKQKLDRMKKKKADALDRAVQAKKEERERFDRMQRRAVRAKYGLSTASNEEEDDEDPEEKKIEALVHEAETAANASLGASCNKLNNCIIGRKKNYKNYLFITLLCSCSCR